MDFRHSETNYFIKQPIVVSHMDVYFWHGDIHTFANFEIFVAANLFPCEDRIVNSGIVSKFFNISSIKKIYCIILFHWRSFIYFGLIIEILEKNMFYQRHRCLEANDDWNYIQTYIQSVVTLYDTKTRYHVDIRYNFQVLYCYNVNFCDYVCNINTLLQTIDKFVYIPDEYWLIYLQ